MGRFTLSDAQREAIVAFVLGLVRSRRPKHTSISPTAGRRRSTRGARCWTNMAAECHTLELERWTLHYDPAVLPRPPQMPDFDFLAAPCPPAELAASKRIGRQGLSWADIMGMPRLDARGRPQEDEDDEGRPVYFFGFWEPAAIGGQLWRAGGPELPVAKSELARCRPPLGGTLARLLYPVAIAEAKAAGAAAPQAEAWGLLPPPLVHEGRKVQPGWLHDYLLTSHAIRPAAMLRMPQYHLSAAEVDKLVDYFAAAAARNSPIPSVRPMASFPRPGKTRPAGRLDRALKIVLDHGTYCGVPCTWRLPAGRPGREPAAQLEQVRSGCRWNMSAAGWPIRRQCCLTRRCR